MQCGGTFALLCFALRLRMSEEMLANYCASSTAVLRPGTVLT